MKAIAKAAVLWAVLMVAGVIGGLPFHWDVAPQAKGEPWPLFTGLVLVAAIGAGVLTLLAERARWRGWKLGLAPATVLFLVESGLSEIEAAAFNNDLHIPMAMLVNGTLSTLLRDMIAGVAIAFLWRSGETVADRRLAGVWWKPAVIAVVYFICYFAAGLWAFAQPATHSFYTHGPQIKLAFLAELELGRGLVWSLPAYLLARGLKGPAWSIALLTGVTFSLLMAGQLLLPNAFMPWPVRCVHLAEIGVSNLVFGGLASLIWLSGSKAPSSATRP